MERIEVEGRACGAEITVHEPIAEARVGEGKDLAGAAADGDRGEGLSSGARREDGIATEVGEEVGHGGTLFGGRGLGHCVSSLERDADG